MHGSARDLVCRSKEASVPELFKTQVIDQSMATTALFGHESPRRSTPETEKKRSIKRIIDTSAFEEDEGVNEGYGPQFSAIRSLSPEGDIANKLRAKERRRRSVALNMLEAGDSLRLADNPRIAGPLAKNGTRLLRCIV